MLYDLSQRSVVGPLCRKVAADRSITALVGANDAIALGCLDFLRSEKVVVPHDLSVVGFDDSMQALVNHLTSYNFNATACIQAMIRDILSPRSRSAGKQRVVELDGFVTARGSSTRNRTGLIL
jgi:LacI family transcriptional regulator